MLPCNVPVPMDWECYYASNCKLHQQLVDNRIPFTPIHSCIKVRMGTTKRNTTRCQFYEHFTQVTYKSIKIS